MTEETPKMGPDFFKFLPSEIILNILSRLPTPTAMCCKCVCKPWLNLLETPEFVKAHLSKLVPGLALFLDGEFPKPYKVFEFADELNPKPYWNMILNFNLPIDEPPYTSADGLFLLCNRGMLSHDIFTYEYVMWPRDLFICNPITCEYIKLPCPPEPSSSEPQVEMYTFGFGASRVTGQYKLVRVFHEWPEWVIDSPESAEPAEPACQVYSIGTGSWSRVASAGPFKYEGNAKGAYVDGNIHWMVCDLDGSSLWISCFDLETELFSTISPPPLHNDREDCVNLSTLSGCLCLCDNSGDDEIDEIVIWLMKEYGDERSWTKEFVIHKQNHYYDIVLSPIKAFQNGDILMALENCNMLLYFSNETKIIHEVDMFGLESGCWINAVAYAPSFLSLKTLAMENVSSF